MPDNLFEKAKRGFEKVETGFKKIDVGLKKFKGEREAKQLRSLRKKRIEAEGKAIRAGLELRERRKIEKAEKTLSERETLRKKQSKPGIFANLGNPLSLGLNTESPEARKKRKKDLDFLRI